MIIEPDKIAKLNEYYKYRIDRAKDSHFLDEILEVEKLNVATEIINILDLGKCMEV